MKNIAIYAGTFDPVTYGHVDLVQRAAALFDKVIVAISANPKKTPLFSLEERVRLAVATVGQTSNVEVSGFDSLLLDVAKQYGANIILRGLRTVTDFDYEFQLASMNRHMNPKVESLFLMPAEKYMYISSSLVREIAELGGDVSGFVPPVIAKALKSQFGK